MEMPKLVIFAWARVLLPGAITSGSAKFDSFE